jgi:hypothetical protein
VLGELLAKAQQPLDGQVLQPGAGFAEDRRRQARHLGRGQQLVGREARRQRDRVAPRAERLGQHLLGVAALVRAQRGELPVLVLGVAVDRRMRADEGPAPDLRGHVALLGQPPVDPGGREVVDRRRGRELAGRRQLRAGTEDAALDVGGDAIGQTRRERARAGV